MSGTIADVPGDGTVVAAQKSFPVGTVCAVSEKLDSAGIGGYTLTPPATQNLELTVKNQTFTATFTNKYDRDMATFAVKKTVTGLADGVVVPKFAFDYNCMIPGQENPVKGVIKDVLADGKPVAVGRTFPVETTCVLSEQTEGTAISGYTLSAPEGQSIVLKGKDQVVEAAFTNAYTRDMATFAVMKNVQGLADPTKAPKFSFDYTCTVPDTNETITGVIADVVAGAEATSVGKQFPTGTVCAISEKLDATAVEGYTLTAPEAQTIKLEEKDQTVQVSVNNVYTLDVATFSVKKNVEGLAKGVVAPKFAFKYSCVVPGQQAPVTGVIKDVVAGAEAIKVGQDFPINTECTITENADGAGIAGYTLTAPQAQKVKLEQKDQVVELAFVNVYKEKPTTVPSVIAKTGANAGAIAALSVIFMGVGLVAVQRRKR